ncbi:MAG TPA: DNA polymerase Y family protein [Polyangiaceae bacterium]|nr:DNA polymerase Y family protein [Polyangiaceae bacterium]
MRRIAAVVLPWFRVELVRARGPGLEHAPIAVVVSDASERSLSGGTRVDDVSSEAREYGVRPSATIASAKARCHDLRVRTLSAEEVTRALRGLCESLLALGAITSPLPDRDAVLVDVTGCAHLVRTVPDSRGDPERALLAAIERTVRAAGYACRIAIASGPEIAWALATGLGESSVVPEEATARALEPLSIDVLRLDDAACSYLRRLGIGTLGQLRALPRAALASRIGEARATHVLALLDGDDPTPLARFEPEELLSEHVSLDWGTEHTEALFFLFKGLCDRLAARLSGRCAVAARLEVVLEMDRAFAKPDERTRVVSLPLASPLQKSEDMQAVLRSRFEREPPLAAPVVGVAVRAPELATRKSQALHLFVPESRAALALPSLAAELSALLGEGRAGTLAAVDDWRTPARSRFVPFGQPRTSLRPRSTARLVGDAPEPLRLYDAPAPDPSALRVIAPVARFEHVAWWRKDPDAPRRRDLVLAWTGSSEAGGAVVFVEKDEHGRARIRGVLD